MSWNNNRHNNNSNNRNNGSGGENVNGVVIPIGNGAVVTGKVRNGTRIVTTVKQRKRKNFIKQTFTVKGESYIPTEKGSKVNKSARTIRGRVAKPDQNKR